MKLKATFLSSVQLLNDFINRKFKCLATQLQQEATTRASLEERQTVDGEGRMENSKFLNTKI